MLLLDEPTSGLDSSAALEVVKLAASLARLGMAVLATIHQPSGAAFAMFDRLLVMVGGRPAYFGPCGGAALAYFSRQQNAAALGDRPWPVTGACLVLARARVCGCMCLGVARMCVR